jgi:non-heme chloroperoxidase
VPIADSALLSAKIVAGATLKIHKGAPHGMPMTLKNEINAKLLEFFRQDQPATSPKRETVAST